MDMRDVYFNLVLQIFHHSVSLLFYEALYTPYLCCSNDSVSSIVKTILQKWEKGI